MANTPKIKRLWTKQEKRIVKLLYTRGHLKDYKDDFYWTEDLYLTKKTYKTKSGKFRWHVYMPQVCYTSTDYWGESDSHSIVDNYLFELYYTTGMNEDGEPKEGYKSPSRQKLIKMLSKQPKVINDNKIKYVLTQKQIDY